MSDNFTAYINDAFERCARLAESKDSTQREVAERRLDVLRKLDAGEHLAAQHKLPEANLAAQFVANHGDTLTEQQRDELALGVPGAVDEIERELKRNPPTTAAQRDASTDQPAQCHGFNVKRSSGGGCRTYRRVDGHYQLVQ